MTAPPKRRWFRFSLRTMFVVVVVLAIPLGWLAWQIQIVRERKAILGEIRLHVRYDLLELQEAEEQTNGYCNYAANDHVRVPGIRRLLGDETYLTLFIDPPIDASLMEKVEYAFPEAEIYALLIPGAHVAGYPESRMWAACRDSLYSPADIRGTNSGTIFKTGLIQKPSTAPTP